MWHKLNLEAKLFIYFLWVATTMPQRLLLPYHTLWFGKVTVLIIIIWHRVFAMTAHWKTSVSAKSPYSEASAARTAAMRSPILTEHIYFFFSWSSRYAAWFAGAFVRTRGHTTWRRQTYGQPRHERNFCLCTEKRNLHWVENSYIALQFGIILVDCDVIVWRYLTSLDSSLWNSHLGAHYFLKIRNILSKWMIIAVIYST